MGLVSDLGYVVEPPGRLQRTVQRLAAGRRTAWVLSRTLYRADKALFRATGGRSTFPSLLAGLPVIMLTTTGARSGRPRTMPLVGIPLGDDLAVIGSNYGRRSTPGWVHNLEAEPSAVVGYRDRVLPVTARRADARQTNRTFEIATGLYPGYSAYRIRAAHRDTRVFILHSAD